MAALIPLTRQKYAIVDDVDYEWLSRYKWVAAEGRLGHFYAQTRYPIGTDEHGKTVYRTREMQRVILDPRNEFPRTVLADHKNHDTQDNCRSNLRWLTINDSNRHRRISHNKTGFRGVFLNPRSGRFIARIKVGSKYVGGGTFATPEEAAVAVNGLLLKHYPETAILNVIRQG